MSLLSMSAICLAGLGSAAAQTTYPTVSGLGQHKDKIIWMSWGSSDSALTTASTSSTLMMLGSKPLVVTCRVASITALNRSRFPWNNSSGGLKAYKPGSWRGDGLDDLYHVGGTNTSNTAVWGIANANDNADYRFSLRCSATLDGAPYKIPGFVVADAEQAGVSVSVAEYVAAEGNGSWRILERRAAGNCASQAYYGAVAASTVTSGFTRLSLTAASNATSACVSPGGVATHGPMAIGFLNFNAGAYVGANYEVQLNAELSGGGTSALALGLLSPYVDVGDAPASYGTAIHTVSPKLEGGQIAPGADVNINTDSFQLARFTTPADLRLGAMVDIDGNGAGFQTESALTDDNTGVDDDDGVDVASLRTLSVLSVGTYQVPVSCVAGSGMQVRGWIDFNRNGVFDANEASQTQACAASGVALLNFTLPAVGVMAAGRTYLRVRGALDAAEIAQPSGVASVGEVEDYALDITGSITLSKTSYGNSGSFSFNLSNAGTATQSVSTQAVGTAVSGTPIAVSRNGQAIVLAEQVPAGWKADAVTCTKQGGTAAFAPTYDIANAQVTIPSTQVDAGASFSCSFTNSVVSDLSLTKGNGSVGGAGVISGSQTTYQLTVTHRGDVPLLGVVLRDEPVSGITCPASNPVTCSSNACPSGLTVGALTGAAGVTLGAIAANESVVLSFECTVD